MSPRISRFAVALSIPLVLGGCMLPTRPSGSAGASSAAPPGGPTAGATSTTSPSNAPEAPTPAAPATRDPDISDADLASWTAAQGDQVPVRTLLRHTLDRVKAEKSYQFSFRVNGRLTDGVGDLNGTTQTDTAPSGTPQRRLDISFSGTSTLPTWARRMEYLQLGDGVTYVTFRNRSSTAFRATNAQLPAATRESIAKFSDPPAIITSSYDVAENVGYEGAQGTGSQKRYLFGAFGAGKPPLQRRTVTFSIDGRGRLVQVTEMQGLDVNTALSFSDFGEPSHIQAPPANLVRSFPSRKS